jgi:MarR family transcriptional regulator, transcriptional regulator for hemolysin
VDSEHASGLFLTVSRLYLKRFEQRARAHGMTLQQCKVLFYLGSYEGISQVQLGQLTDIEPMTLVRILDRLQSRGILERRHDRADRRARRIYLRPEGKPLVEAIWHTVELTRQEAFAGIRKRHAALMIAVLENVQHNLAARVSTSL